MSEELSTAMEAVTAIGDRPDLWAAAPADGEASQSQSQLGDAGICQWRPFPLSLPSNNIRRSLGDGYAGCGTRSGDGWQNIRSDARLSARGCQARGAAPNPTGIL